MNATRMLAGVFVIAGAGCVSRQSPHPDWPAATSLKGLSQLDGVYRNDSDDHRTGQRGESTRSLYDFLNGRLATSRKEEGREVELRASPDGKELRVQLRGARGKILASETLRADHGDFILTRNSLAVTTPGKIGETGITNLGVFAGDASARVRRSRTGSLLGYQSETAAGLFGFMIPTAASSSERYH